MVTETAVTALTLNENIQSAFEITQTCTFIHLLVYSHPSMYLNNMYSYDAVVVLAISLFYDDAIK